MPRFTSIRLIQATFAVLCVTSFVYLFQSHSYIRTYTGAHSEVLPLDDHIQRVREFWSPFEQHIRDAQPHAPKIQLGRGSASALTVKDNDAPRPETGNLVTNTEEVAEGLITAHAQFRSILDLSFDDTGKPKTSRFEGVFSNEGIVMVAGGEYFGPAIAGIQMLRRTGSTLPVEAFVANSDEYEHEVCKSILPALNARCVVLTDFIDAQHGFEITHYQLKSLAILFSSFEHVLYLDSDSVPLVNPHAELFTKEPYLSKGLVNWPDFWQATESPLFYVIAGLRSFPTGLPATSTEAGQLLVDKSRHLKTLLLAAYYNIYGPKWYYPLLSQGALGQGDKNTFESAAIALGLPWYRVRTPVKALGRHDTGQFRGSAMVQFHPGDDEIQSGETPVAGGAHTQTTKVRPAFVHANTPKLNAGHLVDEGDLQDQESKERLRLWGPVDDQIELFGFDVEKAAFAYMVESGCKWGAVLSDWKHRENLCERLNQHFSDVFS